MTQTNDTEQWNSDELRLAVLQLLLEARKDNPLCGGRSSAGIMQELDLPDTADIESALSYHRQQGFVESGEFVTTITVSGVDHLLAELNKLNCYGVADSSLYKDILHAIKTRTQIKRGRAWTADLLRPSSGIDKSELEFAMWYLHHSGYIELDDKSLIVTTRGIEFLSQLELAAPADRGEANFGHAGSWMSNNIVTSNALHKATLRASETARMRRHECVQVAHLLGALIHDEKGKQIIHNCGGDVTRMRDEINQSIETIMTSLDESADYVMRQAPGFKRVMTTAIGQARASGMRQLDIGDVLAAMFMDNDDPFARDIFEQHGIKRLDVLKFISHAVSTLEDADPQGLQKATADSEAKFQVVLRNDNYTPMEFVVHICKSIFDLPEQDAVKIMFNVHERGFGVVGTYDAYVARDKAMTVQKLADDAGFPLLCTLEPEQRSLNQ